MNNLLVQTEEDRILSDPGTEKAILACLMKEPAKMVEASTKLKSEDFFEEKSRYLFSIMLALYNKKAGKDCKYDIATLRLTARNHGKEEEFENKTGIEFIAYLDIVMNSMIDLSSFDTYVNKIYELSLKRKLIQTNESFKKVILESDKTPEELMTEERILIDGLFINSANNGNNLNNLGAGVLNFINKALNSKKQYLGIPTKFPRLDSILQGLKRGNVIIVAAAKKTGKSSFLMNVGINVGIDQKIPTLMISTEMSDEEIMSRAISKISEVREIDILKGSLKETEKERVFSAERKFRDGSFYHTEMRGFTVEKVVGLVRKFVNNVVGFREDGKPKDCLVIFDYIKMPSSTSQSMRDKEYKVLGMFADSLKELAGDLNIPILTACQTNRSGEIANSYEITWFCNTFMVLEKKSLKEIEKDNSNNEYKGNQRLKIMDNRGGLTEELGIDFQYDGPTLSYMELAQQAEKHA